MPPAPRRDRLVPKLALISSLYPLALVASLYVTWLIGRLALGWWPRPHWDDPKSIGLSVDVAYVVTGLLLVGYFPVLLGSALLTLAAMCRRGASRWRWRDTLSVLGAAAAWMGVWIWLRWDPADLMEWFMD